MHTTRPEMKKTPSGYKGSKKIVSVANHQYTSQSQMVQPL